MNSDEKQKKFDELTEAIENWEKTHTDASLLQFDIRYLAEDNSSYDAGLIRDLDEVDHEKIDHYIVRATKKRIINMRSEHKRLYKELQKQHVGI